MQALLFRRLALGAAAALLAPPVLAQRDSPFMAEFRKLIPLQAKDEMATLIKKHEVEAIRTVREIVMAMREGSNEELEVEIDALGRAWKKAYDTDFVSLQYDYFALRLTGPLKKEHRDVTARYDQKRKEFDAAVAAKDTAKYALLAQDFEPIGDHLGELGDNFLASECYWNCGVLYDEALNGNKADFRKACECWGLCVQAREEAQLHDKSFVQAKQRHDQLMTDGFGGPEPDPAAKPAEPPPPPAGADAPAAAPKSAPLAATFQLVADIEAVQRPMFTADSNFQIWASVPLQKIGSKAGFPAIENSPSVLRTGANKATVDVDGNGTGDVDIPLTGKITPVQITLGTGDEKRDWAFLAVIGQQQDTYQGFKFNLGPDEANMNLYVAAAGSLVGTVAGTRVQVFDDNLDGLYGGPPKDWGYIGLIDGALQHDTDSVLIGESKVARPWSRLQKIGDVWYELVRNAGGTDFLATPAQVQTGTLQLDLKGLPVTWLVVRGMGDKEDLFFDVANGGADKVEVPAGTYQLYMGEVASGKKTQMMKAVVLPSGATRSWRVGAGETVKMELGAPFNFDFTLKQDEENVTVDGPSIVVTGRGGETYQRLWNCVLAPEVHLRKAGSGKGKKEKDLVPVTSQEELMDQKYDFKTVWFPVGVPIKKQNSGETCEAMLFQKKHKLFGKVESPWKGQ